MLVWQTGKAERGERWKDGKAARLEQVVGDLFGAAGDDAPGQGRALGGAVGWERLGRNAKVRGQSAGRGRQIGVEERDR